jgi:hypothetical protein
MNSERAANTAIHDGLVLDGQLCRCRIPEREPQRCLNCQKYTNDHIAVTCPNNTACAKCSEHHTSSTCDKHDPQDFACINCKIKGHTVYDRDCPVYKREQWKVKWGRRGEGSTYKYYPTDDPTTWEQRRPSIDEDFNLAEWASGQGFCPVGGIINTAG